MLGALFSPHTFLAGKGCVRLGIVQAIHSISIWSGYQAAIGINGAFVL